MVHLYQIIKNDFAAIVTDEEEDSGLSTEKEFGTDDAKNTEESDTNDEETTDTTGEYDTISDEDETRLVEPTPSSQSSFSDNEGEEAEIQLPSAILQFLEEP